MKNKVLLVILIVGAAFIGGLRGYLGAEPQFKTEGVIGGAFPAAFLGGLVYLGILLGKKEGRK